MTAAPAESTNDQRPAPKRVRKNPDTRRAEIVATARQVFADTGYAESGLAEIASAAQVSKGLLYHYFPEGRPQLFVSVMQELLAEFQQRLRQAAKVPFSPRTRMEHLLAALFWFFDDQNYELLVKTLDGCAINGHFWVFAAATTNVEYALTVIDSETGRGKTYFSPLHLRSRAIADAQAFPCP